MKLVNVLFLISPLLLLSGCLLTRSEVQETENKKVMQDQMSTMQKSTAEQNLRYSDIESDLRDLSGKTEVLDHKITAIAQDREKLKKANDDQLAETNKKVDLLQEEVTKMQAQMGQLLNEISQKLSTPAPTVSNEGTKGPMEMGDELINAKDFKKAVVYFQKFRDANPKSKKFAEATYKIGVCFQEMDMKDEAKTFFDEVISKFPNSTEAKKAKIRLKKTK